MGKNINAPLWVRAFFHSFSQVVLVENVISGVLILAATFIFSWQIGDWNFGIIGILAAIVGNVTAKLLGNDEDAIAAGLFGFNPVLVGLGAATFFTGMDVYVVGILGSILVVPLQVVINNLCSRKGLPGFTMPFIAMTWFFILVSFQTGLLDAGRAGALAGPSAVEAVAPDWPGLLTKGIAQIYLIESVIASLVILAAFAIDRWHLALKIAGVILVSIGMGFIFNVNFGLQNIGLFTYNSILVLMGMETFSKNKDNTTKYCLLVFLGLVAVGLVDYASPAVLSPFALPTLTFPFVFVTWGLLYYEQHLKSATS